ncbi:unnamed protein product [Gongylonema pulchrum]|uniref:Mediator of RNA polymerase II transcription subunit 21 n=1 Tax=Gongylonema pulchrum TaxID=637853 RepID=A0A183EZN4_9BILA|nr:unnamed protein product [Gongylonema pulchrum]
MLPDNNYQGSSAVLQLYNFLEQISSSLSSQISSATDVVRKNALEIANQCVRVSSLNNRLSSFAADQFIESRVNDEDAVAAPIRTPNTECTDKRAELADNLRAAVALGIDVIRTRFKRIEMRPEDFDEVDDPAFMPEPIFEPYVRCIFFFF